MLLRKCSCQYLKHIVTIHCRSFSLLPETAFARSFLVEQAKGHASQQSEVFRTIVSPDTRNILAKGDIQNPVELIFNAPMGTNCTTDLNGIAGERTEIKLNLTGGLVPKMPDSDDHDDAL